MSFRCDENAGIFIVGIITTSNQLKICIFEGLLDWLFIRPSVFIVLL